jgi:hypothetical protein
MTHPPFGLILISRRRIEDAGSHTSNRNDVFQQRLRAIRAASRNASTSITDILDAASISRAEDNNLEKAYEGVALIAVPTGSALSAWTSGLAEYKVLWLPKRPVQLNELIGAVQLDLKKLIKRAL